MQKLYFASDFFSSPENKMKLSSLWTSTLCFDFFLHKNAKKQNEILKSIIPLV